MNAVLDNQSRRDAWVAGFARRVPEGARVLDVGAGECRYRGLFAHCEYRAHDFAAYRGTQAGTLRQDWAYGELDYVSDIAEIPVEAESFDAVLCTEVLEHVPRPEAGLAEIARILRPGGVAALSAPLGSGLHQEPFHYYGGFTPYFWQRELDAVGLEVVELEPSGGFFRLLGQEVSRGASFLLAARRYPRLHPFSLLARAAGTRRAERWFAALDEAIPVREFTVGYHVEARKPPA